MKSNIRKHWKKIILSITAFFWASCTSESTTQPLYGVVCPPEGCDNHGIESSSSEAVASSSSEANAPSSSSIGESSSSENAPSSSSETVASSSSEPASSNSGEVTCTPGDSVISYYPPAYSESVAKSNAEEKANRAGVAKIDSIMKAQQSIPASLADLRQQLSMFVALYGAPMQINTEEVCSDGTTRSTKEYLDYLKMKEEWEKNKPALDEECKKIYEDKLKAIEQDIKKCLESSNPSTDLTACNLEAMCPEYGVDSKCSYDYNCVDGVSCREKEGKGDFNCTDKQGNEIKYTQKEFDKKYYIKDRY